MEEHTVAIVSFEGAIKREMKHVREVLRDAEVGSEFCLTVKCSGRVQDGDVKIEYRLGKDSYSDETAVKGNAAGPVLEEYLRRHGWKRAHAPKAISYDEIPS